MEKKGGMLNALEVLEAVKQTNKRIDDVKIYEITYRK